MESASRVFILLALAEQFFRDAEECNPDAAERFASANYVEISQLYYTTVWDTWLTPEQREQVINEDGYVDEIGHSLSRDPSIAISQRDVMRVFGVLGLLNRLFHQPIDYSDPVFLSNYTNKHRSEIAAVYQDIVSPLVPETQRQRILSRLLKKTVRE